MNDEKKTYSVVGTVTIGTDEYRDLITDLAEAKKDYEAANRARWAVERERDEFKKALATQENNNRKYHDYIYADRARLDDYIRFCTMEEDEEV